MDTGIMHIWDCEVYPNRKVCVNDKGQVGIPVASRSWTNCFYISYSQYHTPTMKLYDRRNNSLWSTSQPIIWVGINRYCHKIVVLFHRNTNRQGRLQIKYIGKNSRKTKIGIRIAR